MTLEIQNSNTIEIPLDHIMLDPKQPRDNFVQEEIEELGSSIKAFGVIQPIIVAALKNGKYKLIAGERRWRASQLIKNKTIPAIVRDNNLQVNSIISLLENVQRRELSHIEKAKGFMQIIKTHNFDLQTKEVISSLWRIHGDKFKEVAMIDIDHELKEILLHVGKGATTVISWLKTITLDEEIISKETSKSHDKKMSGDTLSRISTIQDKDLQKRVYNKFENENDDLQISPSKFITKIKKMDKQDQENLLANNDIEYSQQDDLRDYNDDEYSFQTALSVQEPLEEKSFQQDPRKNKRHVDKISNSQLYIEKNMWNNNILQDKITFYSTGTDGKNINQFSDILKSIKKNKLIIVDVRANPFSRYKPDFNKGNLQEKLSSLNIEYIHIPELGIHKDLRNKMYNDEISETDLWDLYDKEIFTEELKNRINQIMEDHTPIFMCTEISPSRCHRHIIANWLLDSEQIGFDL